MKHAILTFSFFLLSIPFAVTQEEITVSSIHVWIAVEGSKTPLSEKDFEVFEDGKKMTPTCFESSNGATANEQVEGVSQIVGRKAIAIFFDQLNTSKPEFAFIRARVGEFLNDIDGRSRIMLAAFPPFERLVSFTTDVNEIRNALESLNVNHERDFTIMKRRSQIQLFLDAKRVEDALNLALEFQQFEIQEVRMYLDSLKDLASFLSNESDANEHTVVMLISGGINSRPGQQYLDMLRKYTDIGQNPLNQPGSTSFDVRNALKKTIGRLNRDNLTIYTISTRGQIDVIDATSRDVPLSMEDQKAYREDYQNTLYQIATETGGLAFENSLNFKHGFGAILNDLSQQYLLCYQAPEHDDDGEYHEIKVKSKVKGVKLRHRKGYVD